MKEEPLVVMNAAILSVCVYVRMYVMDRHPIFAFVPRDPYPLQIKATYVKSVSTVSLSA